MKTIYASIILLSTALLLIFILQRTMRTKEARILRNLRAIENLLSKAEDEPAAAGIIRAARAAEHFTQDCRINVNGMNISGRAELSSAIHTARAAAGGLSVRLHDVSISITGEGSAEVRLTATARAGGMTGETLAREAVLEFFKLDGAWKIKTAETVEVLR